MEKKRIIPFVCLVLAIIFLYLRPFVLEESSESKTSPHPQPNISGDMIIIHYHERPPYYSTGPFGVYGLCADPVKQAFNKAGIKFKWEKTPAAKQLELLKKSSSKICLIGWFKNSEREKLAKFSHYIYQDRPALALARADNSNIFSGITIKTLFQNKSIVLLKKDGYSYGPFIDTAILKFNPRQKITNAENIGLLKMIHAMHADYFFITEEEAQPLIYSSGLLKTDFKLIKIRDMPEGNKRYLLFSKEVEDGIINKIDAQLKKIVKNNI